MFQPYMVIIQLAARKKMFRIEISLLSICILRYVIKIVKVF